MLVDELGTPENTFLPKTGGIVAVKIRCFSWEQEVKALFPIVFKLSGKVKLTKVVHVMKAALSMIVTDEILTSFKATQFPKADLPIRVALGKEMDSKDAQFIKAEPPTMSKSSEVTDHRLPQP